MPYPGNRCPADLRLPSVGLQCGSRINGLRTWCFFQFKDCNSGHSGFKTPLPKNTGVIKTIYLLKSISRPCNAHDIAVTADITSIFRINHKVGKNTWHGKPAANWSRAHSRLTAHCNTYMLNSGHIWPTVLCMTKHICLWYHKSLNVLLNQDSAFIWRDSIIITELLPPLTRGKGVNLKSEWMCVHVAPEQEKKRKLKEQKQT